MFVPRVHGVCFGLMSAPFGVWQVPSSPPPLAAPIARRLSISASVAGDDGLLSCVLPDDLLCDILADRFMVSQLILVCRSPKVNIRCVVWALAVWCERVLTLVSGSLLCGVGVC